MTLAAAFLDRDGTIIRDPGYVSDASEVELLPRAAAAIARLNARGIRVIVVTNQSGIGRGYYTEADFLAVQAEVERRLAMAGCALDAVYHCPHDPRLETCGCRKPGLDLYRHASERFGFRLSEAIFVGDKEHDVLPAALTGARGYLVRSGQPVEGPPPERCTLVDDLWVAVEDALGGESDG